MKAKIISVRNYNCNDGKGNAESCIGKLQGCKDGGFTLIELIVVVAVISLLLSVLVPPVLAYKDRIAEREMLANQAAISDAIRQCYALEGRYPPVVGDTGLDYLRDNYRIIMKPDVYVYTYTIVDGSPELSVEARSGK